MKIITETRDDGLPVRIRDIDDLKLAELRSMVSNLIATLYIDHNFDLDPDTEWDGGTIERVADILAGHGLKPVFA